ncbi:MAG: apolipoprotein N-acyltransferase [Acidiferrobacter sp.]
MQTKAKWQVRFGASSWVGEPLALVAGALLNLAFAPYRLVWMAPVALALLYWLLGVVSGRRAFSRGWLFGVGFFATGVPWVYVTLVHFGGMPAPIAALSCGLFVGILSVYLACLGFAFALLRGSDRFDPWLFAALWVMGEWARDVFLTGFPWLDVGYAASAAPLIHWAPLIGVLGLSFILALAGALLMEAARGRWAGVWPLVLFLAATPLIGRLSFVHRTGQAITASLVQGDISPYVKWDPRGRRAIIRRYLKLTQKSDGQLVIWPETAVPGYSHELRRHFIPLLRHMARVGHRHFLFGLVEGDPYVAQGPIYNAVMSVGRHEGFYRKRHLVPFGEYLPWPDLLNPILQVLHIPMSGFTPWHGREHPLAACGAQIGVSICYEIAYGPIVTQALPQATLLVNVSDDSWYGHSNEARQQLQIAQLRAAEAGRDMLIATNDGQTARVTHRGRIAARLAPFHPGVLTVVAQPYAGSTPYDRIGDDGVLGFVSLVGLVALGRARSRRRSH